MRRDLRIANEFNLESIRNLVESEIVEILEYAKEGYIEPGETNCWMLEYYAPDWLGVHQAEHIKDSFGLRLKLDEWAWDEIDRIFDDVATILNKRLSLTHPDLDYMLLGFGHGEGSPDWGLMLYFEMKG